MLVLLSQRGLVNMLISHFSLQPLQCLSKENRKSEDSWLVVSKKMCSNQWKHLITDLSICNIEGATKTATVLQRNIAVQFKKILFYFGQLSAKTLGLELDFAVITVD